MKKKQKMKLFELFQIVELGEPNTVTKTPEEIAEKYAALGKPTKLKNPKNGEWILVSKDLNFMPHGWRITIFRTDKTAYDGHTEFPSAYAAFLEAARQGYTNVDGSVFEDDSYTPPSIEKGDTILKGKFKNSKATVKGFSKDAHNQPILKTNKGNVALFKPRIPKLDN
jgi:hypothetical protein